MTTQMLLTLAAIALAAGSTLALVATKVATGPEASNRAVGVSLACSIGGVLASCTAVALALAS